MSRLAQGAGAPRARTLPRRESEQQPAPACWGGARTRASSRSPPGAWASSVTCPSCPLAQPLSPQATLHSPEHTPWASSCLSHSHPLVRHSGGTGSLMGLCRGGQPNPSFTSPEPRVLVQDVSPGHRHQKRGPHRLGSQLPKGSVWGTWAMDCLPRGHSAAFREAARSYSTHRLSGELPDPRACTCSKRERLPGSGKGKHPGFTAPGNSLIPASWVPCPPAGSRAHPGMCHAYRAASLGG